MIRRIYVDNYKCLVNVDLALQRQQLFLGKNGAGKTALFEVLEGISGLAAGRKSVSESFPAQTLTRWQDSRLQTFRFELQVQDNSMYEYRLELEHDPDRHRSRVASEVVTLDGALLYASRDGTAHLYRDDHSKGAEVLTNPDASGLPFLRSLQHNKKIQAFRLALERIRVVRVDPRSMDSKSPRIDDFPTTTLSNFASWYRHLVQTQLNDVISAMSDLKATLDGFEALNFKPYGGDTGVLEASWSVVADAGKQRTTFSFDELSDGQRALIGLYCMLHSVGTDESATLCLDEPDNFLAMREIQPFVGELLDRKNLQVLVVSHHPETIDYIAPVAALRFTRTGAGKTLIRAVEARKNEVLRASELEARGWNDEE